MPKITHHYKCHRCGTEEDIDIPAVDSLAARMQQYQMPTPTSWFHVQMIPTLSTTMTGIGPFGNTIEEIELCAGCTKMLRAWAYPNADKVQVAGEPPLKEKAKPMKATDDTCEEIPVGLQVCWKCHTGQPVNLNRCVHCDAILKKG